jgi:hypothetical protein
MIWTDGSSYDGDWFRGIQHGYGTITFPDGSEKEGYFDNNVFIGKMKENAGDFIPLDPEKIFPVSGKLTKNKSLQKLTYRSLQPENKNKIDMVANRNRPKPLIKSKYLTSSSNFDWSGEKGGSSLPQLKKSSNSPLPKASQSANKFYSNRVGSQKRRKISNKLFA